MLASVVVLYLAASGAVHALPPGKGKAIVARTCVGCHALKVVTSKRATKEQWSALVDQMVSRGADLNDDEIDTVVDYLSKNFGPRTPPVSPGKKNLSRLDFGGINVNQAPATELAAVLNLSPGQSQAVVAYRDKNGKFKDWRSLANVRGVQVSAIVSKKGQLQF